MGTFIVKYKIICSHLYWHEVLWHVMDPIKGTRRLVTEAMAPVGAVQTPLHSGAQSLLHSCLTQPVLAI